MAGFAPAPLPSLSLVLGEQFTLTAAVGSFALTGQDATFSYGSIGSSENPAPLPHIGLNLGPVTGYTGVSDTGSFLLTGVSAGLYRRYTHVCAVGSYALTGQDATLTKNSVNSTEFPAPLPHLSSLLGGTAGAYSLPALGGSYALTGQDATLRRGVGIIADAGAFVWTGAPALRDMQLTAEAATFTQTWIDPTITATHNPLACEVGAYAVTGFAAGLNYDGTDIIMSAFVGTFDVTGNDAAMDYGLAIQCEAGDFAVAANDVGYETTGTFESATGWRGSGGEDDDDPWWMRLPVKGLPAKVERALDAAAKVPDAQAQEILAKKISRAGVEWQPEYAEVLTAMQEREAATVAALRKQIEQARLQQMRDDDDVAVALLLAA